MQPEQVTSKLPACPAKKKDQLTYGKAEINQAIKRAGAQVIAEAPIFGEPPAVKRVQKRPRAPSKDGEEEKKEGDQIQPPAAKKRAKKAAAKK